MTRTYGTRHKSGKNREHQGQSGDSAIDESAEPEFDLEELHLALLGSVVLAHAKTNSAFHEKLRKLLLTAITDPEDMALFPEFFPPTYPGIH
jgi:hypothetical protein